MTSLPIDNVTGGMPKIMLGREGFSVKKPNENPNFPKKPIPPKPFPADNSDLDPLMEKLRKYGLIGMILIVAGYAAYRLILSFIGG